LPLLTLFIFSNSFSQQQLLGKTKQEALAFVMAQPKIQDTDTADFISHPTYTAHYASEITLSRLEFEWYENWAYLQIFIDSTDHVAEVLIGFDSPFKPNIYLSPSDRKQIVKELTKQFGKSRHTRKNDTEVWQWTNEIGTYEFTRYLPHTCYFDCRVKGWDVK